jgi:hypothetical protein
MLHHGVVAVEDRERRGGALACHPKNARKPLHVWLVPMDKRDLVVISEFLVVLNEIEIERSVRVLLCLFLECVLTKKATISRLESLSHSGENNIGIFSRRLLDLGLRRSTQG